MHKVAVTGAAGFIGSNLVDALLSLGCEVVAIDNQSASSNSEFYWNPQAINLSIDITDYSELAPALQGVHTIFHTAAEARVQPSILNPLRSLETNVMGTATVLQAALANGVKRIVYSMTSSVYGAGSALPNVESNPVHLRTPYAIGKYTGELLCKAYSDLYLLDTVSLRYFNVYGPREPLSGPYAPVIGKFLRQKASGEPLTIVGDGTQRRDFTHVDDVIAANIRAMIYEERLGGEVLNVGSGKNYSINEVAELIGAPAVHIAERPGESQATLSDISKTTALLGWSPKVELAAYLAKFK